MCWQHQTQHVFRSVRFWHNCSNIPVRTCKQQKHPGYICDIYSWCLVPPSLALAIIRRVNIHILYPGQVASSLQGRPGINMLSKWSDHSWTGLNVLRTHLRSDHLDHTRRGLGPQAATFLQRNECKCILWPQLTTTYFGKVLGLSKSKSSLTY